MKVFILREPLRGISTVEGYLRVLLEKKFLKMNKNYWRRYTRQKKGLLEGRWIVKNKESIFQPTFLRTEIIDGKVSFEFSVDIDPVKLDERKTEIEEDFVEQIDKEIETNIRKGVRP